MKTELTRLFKHEAFDREQAKDALIRILTQENNQSFVASFLTAYNMRQPTIAELQGFAEAMMEMCNKVELDADDAIDIVGTGGDGKNTFNISTLSSIVVAASGCRVIKHGNYGSSSVCGSSNVLESLGYKFTTDSDKLKQQLDEANICFLHAPLFHPLMAKVKQVRKDLSLQTFFNLLGPLVNPASPGKQMLGVSHHAHIRNYEYLLQQTGKEYCIIHAMDGYDEISLTGDFKAITRNSNDYYCPEDIGMKKISPAAIEAGESIGEATAIFLNILNGKGTEQQNMVVIANSAFGIRCLKPDQDIASCVSIATDILKSGEAFATFNKLIQKT